ncbi:MAG: hypothetical protein GXP55_00970 [Deltaproteobacteria bacterium]|nr:hypothetical protein [Deltaproteobacteria bacterium]
MAWARVKLARGESSAGLWDLSSEVPEARIVVGSGPEAGWQVQAPGVFPAHFELFWDGASLWVSAGRGVPVSVDGSPVVDWRQTVGRAQVEFGQASMSIESSFTGVSDFADDPAGSTVATDDFADFAEEDEGVKTAVFDPNRHSLPDAPPKAEEFKVGSTRLVRMPGHAAPAAPSHGVPEHGAPQAAQPIAAVPGFGGAAAAPSFGGAAAAPAGPIDAESTRILDTSQGSDIPAFGEAGSTRILDTSADPGLAPAARPQVGIGAGGLSEERPTVVPEHLQASAAAVSATKEATGRFAPPPPSADPKPNPFAKLLALPKRTLILAGVTLVVSIVGLSIVISQRSAEQVYVDAQAQLEAQQAQVTAAAAARVVQARAAREARTARELAQQTKAYEEAAPPPALPATDADGQPLDEAELAAARLAAARVRATAERAAADLLVQNDYIHALPHYLRLARDYPDTPAFAAMVRILRAKIDAYCRLPASAGDEACQ